MKISIGKRQTMGESEIKCKEINRETDMHLFHRMLGISADLSYHCDEEGYEHFYHGFNSKKVNMYMGLGVKDLHEEDRKKAQSWVQDIADFFGVEENFIDYVTFIFD